MPLVGLGGWIRLPPVARARTGGSTVALPACTPVSFHVTACSVRLASARRTWASAWGCAPSTIRSCSTRTPRRGRGSTGSRSSARTSWSRAVCRSTTWGARWSAGPSCSTGSRSPSASTEPLDWEYLRKLKALVQRTRSPWVSDHLCWGSAGGVHLHDLLPLPYTAATVQWVAERARAVQDFLGVRLALENVSSYMTFTVERDDRVGVRHRRRRGGGLRHPPRREQHLRLRVQPRLRCQRLRRRRARRAGGADPPGRAHQPRQVHPRHPQRPRDRSRVGALPPRAPTHVGRCRR